MTDDDLSLVLEMLQRLEGKADTAIATLQEHGDLLTRIESAVAGLHRGPPGSIEGWTA
jgi:hypothetical protein